MIMWFIISIKNLRDNRYVEASYLYLKKSANRSRVTNKSNFYFLMIQNASTMLHLLGNEINLKCFGIIVSKMDSFRHKLLFPHKSLLNRNIEELRHLSI